MGRIFFRTCAALVAVALFLMGAPALADTVRNSIGANGSTQIGLIGTEGSTVVTYFVQAAGDCDPADGTPVTLSLTIAGPAGVTASPSSFTISDCGQTHGRAVTFTANTSNLDPRTVSVSASGDPTGQYSTSPANLNLTFANTNTPPQVGVGGVVNGQSYEFGQVPAATCSVIDAQDPSPSAQPTFSAIAGPLAPLGLGSQTATCTYTDSGGLSGTASATYSIVDTTAPLLTTPGDITLEANVVGGRHVTFSASATDAVDLAGVTCLPASGSLFAKGGTPVTCTATDAAGNHSSGTFTVTITDSTPPNLVLTTPGPVEATGSGGAMVTFNPGTATDIYDGILPITCVPPSGSTFSLGTTPVDCSATDSSNHTSTGSFNVQVVDTTTPTLTVPDSMTLEATSPAGASAIFSASATDLVSGGLTASCDAISGSMFGFGTTSVTCSATDGAGNSQSGSFTVTVNDTTAPDLTVPANYSVEATGPTGALVTYTPRATDAGSASVTVTCIPASGSVLPLGANLINCTGVDAHANHTGRSFTVTVEDTTDPIVHVPGHLTEEATGPAGSPVTWAAATSDDEVSGHPNVVCDHTSGDTFPLGDTIVTCSSTDSAGNEGTASFSVTVEDTTAPDVTVPANITNEATSAAGAVAMFAATAHDLVDGDLTPVCDPASGSTFPLPGPTTVTCSVTDAHGNPGSTSFTVSVTDLTGPQLHLPDNITEEATGPGGAVAAFAATATDLVDGPTLVVCTPHSGESFALGETTVTCSSHDAHSNANSGGFVVTVLDTTDPILTVPADFTVEATGPGGAHVPFSPSATDIVDQDVAVECTFASGAILPLGLTTMTCTATDDSGNNVSDSFDVTVQDTTAPTLHLPANIAEEATGPAGASAAWADPTGADAVSGDTLVVCDRNSGDTFPLGLTTVGCTSTDGAGNTAHGSFTVTVEDTTKPALTLPADSTAYATGPSGAPVSFTATASDLVDGSVPVTCTPHSGSTFAPGTTTVTCSATDAHGNSRSGSFAVYVGFSWNGFFSPVDNPSVVNTAKGGSTIPLKWSIPNGAGGYVSSLSVVKPIKVTTMSCTSGALADDIEVLGSGDTGLRYDTTADQYVYNWKTPKAAGICYQVEVSLTDDSSHRALFKTK